MNVKMKIRQKFKFTATVAVIAFGVGNKGYTQNSSHAVMDVKVTVVAGSHHTNNTISDFSDQVMKNQSMMSFGNHELNIHEDTEYLVSHQSTIDMNSNENTWNIHTNMTEEKLDNGHMKLHLDGHNLTNIPSGVYSGRHITEINYL